VPIRARPSASLSPDRSHADPHRLASHRARRNREPCGVPAGPHAALLGILGDHKGDWWDHIA
jgi:hypothetical protein